MVAIYAKAEKITDAAAVKAAYKPTHPGLFEIAYAEGDYNSKLVACKPFAKGEIICPIEGIVSGPKRYTSVQVGKDEHIEFNSDRDNMTFFYPSSEWEMDQPFPCWCGAELCISSVKGAKYLSKETMSRYFTANHIKELLNERDA
ncbi:hypothetical protein BG004_002077 [Podila humilis]|nr:hypothetical protein BG004_002077 [Podila humilis]